MEEIWKDIYYFDRRKNEWVDYRGIYQVSNYGRVRSYDRVVVENAKGGSTAKHIYKGKILKPFILNKYYSVNLSRHNKHESKRIHRLVAEMFVDNPENLWEINHKNEDKLDNRACNLEFCTKSYNQNYGHRAENARKALLNHPDLSEPVNQYSLDNEYIDTYPSQMEAERVLNSNGIKITHSQISACCLQKPKHKTAGGFKWSYAYSS